MAGTLVFMAPEVRIDEFSSFSSDMYSFAITVLQIMIRRTPDSAHQALREEQIRNEVSKLENLMKSTELSEILVK
jgi:serine/threonine protein kinase